MNEASIGTRTVELTVRMSVRLPSEASPQQLWLLEVDPDALLLGVGPADGPIEVLKTGGEVRYAHLVGVRWDEGGKD